MKLRKINIKPVLICLGALLIFPSDIIYASEAEIDIDLAEILEEEKIETDTLKEGDLINLENVIKEVKYSNENKKFSQSMETIADLLPPYTNDPYYTPRLLYYYGIAAYHIGNMLLAEKAFKMILLYQNYPKIQEAYYWIAMTKFEQNEYLTALKFIKKIENQELRDDIEEKKYLYLENIDNPKKYSRIIEEDLDDPRILEVVAQRIRKDPYIDLNRIWVRDLINTYKLKIENHFKIHKIKSKKKKIYNIAVLFPFMISDNEEEDKDNNINELISDLYKGIQLAASRLNQETSKSKIAIYAYDTENDIDKIQSIIDSGELKQMDLIIGPLLPKEIELVSKFALDNKINLINPLSSNSNAAEENPYMFLFHPVEKIEGIRAAEAIIAEKGPKRIGVLCRDFIEDKRRIEAFIKTIENNTGYKVELINILSKQDSEMMVNMFRNKLNAYFATKEKQEINNEKVKLFDKLTHLYIATNDKLTVSNIFAVLNIRNLNPVIIGHQKWINNKIISLDTLQRRKVRLILPMYIDYTKDNYKEFRIEYYNVFEEIPGLFSNIGYELMLFYGSQMITHGNIFQKEWDEDPIFTRGISQGIYVGRYSGNTNINMAQIIKGKLVINKNLPDIGLYG